MSHKLKVLFVHQHPWSYVQRDLLILQGVYDVRECHFRGLRDIYPLRRGVAWCDVAFAWFGSLHAFFTVAFARMLRKRTVVVAGGWDVGQPPDGMPYLWYKRWCPQYVFSHCDMTLTVSDFNTQEARANIPNISPVRCIYHGFEVDSFTPSRDVSKERSVLTVGTISHFYNERKGLPLFVQSARYLPNVQFRVVGGWWDSSIASLRALAPPNVTFLGEVSSQDILSIYRRSAAYVQASRHEAFACSLAEAMLCECVPVVTRSAALPEVVGDCGVYVQERTPEALARGISEALKRPELGPRARQRIVDCFPLEKRRREVLKTVEEVASSSQITT
ncbi:MAG: glycosyltransferase family 4 protein [Dehalococcoidia bacterium]|nr:glycosyltransferase family 4 protein [Dehalococcoidia bacterium]